MALPEQLLLSDLLKRRVRCDQGLEHGVGLLVWMHPPVHRVLGWASRPSMFGDRRLVWRLDQLRAMLDLEALVKGDPAETDPLTLERLPTLIEATLLDRDQQPIGTVVDAAFESGSGRIRDYLVSRSDPRLPGSSRWRLSPERIVDQQPGRVLTALAGLDDLPLARASVRQELLRRSRRWRDQVQQVGERFESRLEGWLEEPLWDDTQRQGDAARRDWPEPPPTRADTTPPAEPGREPWDEGGWPEPLAEPEPWHRSSPPGRRRADEDPWV